MICVNLRKSVPCKLSGLSSVGDQIFETGERHLNAENTMKMLNIHEAKTNLSAVLARVEKEGEKFLICRNGKPIAELERLPVVRVDSQFKRYGVDVISLEKAFLNILFPFPNLSRHGREIFYMLIPPVFPVNPSEAGERKIINDIPQDRREFSRP